MTKHFCFYLLLVFCFLFYNSSCSQAISDSFIGVYYSTQKAPEGSPKLFVLDDHFFVIVYFGGIQYGKWEIINQNTCQFTLNYDKQNFTVHGRYEPKLKNTIRMYFENCNDFDSYFAIETPGAEKPQFQRIFNKHPNCTSWPFVHTLKSTVASRLLLRTYTHTQASTTTYNNASNYNDFVIKQYKVALNEKASFSAKIEGQKLLFDKYWSSNKKSLSSLNLENIAFLNKLKKNSNRTVPANLYFNDAYKEFYYSDDYETVNDNIINDLNYFFDNKRNTFVYKHLVNKDLDTPLEDAFHDYRIINKYERLIELPTVEEFKQTEKSIFNYTCGE